MERSLNGLAPAFHETGESIQLPQGATSEEGGDDGADCVAAANYQPTASQPAALTQLTTSSASKRAENTGIPRRRNPDEPLPLTDYRTKSAASRGSAKVIELCSSEDPSILFHRS